MQKSNVQPSRRALAREAFQPGAAGTLLGAAATLLGVSLARASLPILALALLFGPSIFFIAYRLGRRDLLYALLTLEVIGGGAQFLGPIENTRMIMASMSFWAAWLLMRAIALDRADRRTMHPEPLVVIAGIASVVVPLGVAIVATLGA